MVIVFVWRGACFDAKKKSPVGPTVCEQTDYSGMNEISNELKIKHIKKLFKVILVSFVKKSRRIDWKLGKINFQFFSYFFSRESEFAAISFERIIKSRPIGNYWPSQLSNDGLVMAFHAK